VIAVAPPRQQLSITHARARGRRVLVLHGAVDLDSAPGLIATFARAARGDDPLAVDLGDVDAGGVGGMALLVNAVRRLHRCRPGVVVICPPGPIRDAFERTALARRLTLMDDARELAGPAFEAEPALAALVVNGHRQRMTTPGRRATLLAEATLAIERRHADPTLALDDVAREIATSSRQLQRVFAELAASAFRDEVAAVRMQHGAALLQTTDLPVSEVAHRVGYRQAAQFAKAFRRHHGTSPSRLRRLAG
jgi:AraC family transcriptional regulator, regulatory protein of adaptative response / methylphosphotriester-DNA alkyltransferase methyltransferase